MFMFRLLLSLSLVVALAVICPIRCQADAVRALGGTIVEEEGCPCCSGEGSRTPEAPVDEPCSDCVCDGAVDGPRVETVDLSGAMPGVRALGTARPVLPTGCECDAVDARPDAPDGAILRLLMASLVI